MQEHQNDRLIHIWLGRDHEDVHKIVACAPFHSEIQELRCELIQDGQICQSQTRTFEDEIIRVFEFRFSRLIDGQKYQYRLSSVLGPLSLGGGLSQEDLFFTYWRSLKKSDQIVLVSCNGVLEHKGSNFNPWNMWERLYQEFENSKQKPKLIVHGGDQYYQDDVEARWMERLKCEPFHAIEKDFKKDSVENALGHLSNLCYRKLMAQTTSVAMLDDHDITDGDGGRSDSFQGTEFKPEWTHFRDMQLRIFRYLQASRNPEPFIQKTNRAFSFSLNLGDSALIALDLRSEKNARQSRLMEADHLEAVCQAIANPEIQNVMILIPLIPIRYSLEREAKLLKAARSIRAVLPNINPIGTDFLDGFRGIDDDLADVLVSPENLPTFVQILRSMNQGAKKNVRYTILSGDIHAGGSCDVQATVGKDQFHFSILVSSPIGSKPMPTWLEQISRERGLIEIKHNDVTLHARNHQYTTKRNFMLIRPSELMGNQILETVFIFEEGLPGFRNLLFRTRRTSHEPLASHPLASPGLFIFRRNG